VSKLVDPVGKALRIIEGERADKVALQAVLNDTRTAYSKLRGEVAELEKKATAAEIQCRALRQDLATAQGQLKAAEATKAEIAIDVAARRAQIADLESRLAQETGERKALDDENHRLNQRLQAAENRVIALESELNGARQKLQMTEDEKRAQQTLLDKGSIEAARLSRRLAETEAALAAAQGRVRHVEADFAELTTERSRISSALDEVKERHEHELTTQRTRFESLQARAQASEKLLSEARDHLLARAEDLREYDRRNNDLAAERDGLQTRVTELEAERLNRESTLAEVEQSRAALAERAASLVRAFTAKEAALERAEASIAALSERAAALEQTLATQTQTAEQTNAELNAALRRERMERSVVEGALETARKDFSRAMRELMAMQRKLTALEATPSPGSPANAA
jgi:crescentin